MNRATILLIAGLVLLLANISIAEAALPQLITVQGKLSNATTLVPLVGGYSVNFTIWDASTAGNMLYTETQPITTDQFGIFQVLLGSVNTLNLPFDKQYYLQIEVNSSVLSPRHSMTSSAYTYRSGVSNDLQCTDCVSTGKIADDAVTLEKYNCVNMTCSGSPFGFMTDFNTSGICHDVDGCTLRVAYNPSIFVPPWRSAAYGFVGEVGSSWVSMVLQGNAVFTTYTGTYGGASEIVVQEASTNCVVYDSGISASNFSVSCPSSPNSCSYWACD